MSYSTQQLVQSFGDGANLFYVPDSTKPKAKKRWFKNILRIADSLTLNQAVVDGRARWFENWSIYKGNVDMDRYSYAWATFGDYKTMEFKQYPLLAPIIDGIVGEYLSSDISFACYKINPNAVSEKSEQEGELVALHLIHEMWEREGMEQKTGIKLSELDRRLDSLPDNPIKYMKDYRDELDITMNNALRYTITKHRQKMEIANMLYSILIDGRIWGRVVEKNGDAYIENKIPARMLVDYGEEGYVTRLYNEADKLPYVFEEEYMPLNEVLQQYGSVLENGQEDADKLKQQAAMFMSDMKAFNAAYPAYASSAYVDVEYFQKIGTTTWVRVVRGQWWACNNRPVPTDVNADGEKVYEDMEMGDIYEGVHIGWDIYAGMRRKPNIIHEPGNYRSAMTDYFGCDTQLGLIQRGAPLQALYNIIMSHIEFAAVQAGGKATIYYTSEIPNQKDGTPMTIAQMNQQAKVGGAVLRDDKEGSPAGRHPDSGREIDYGISPNVQYLIQIKQAIEGTAGAMLGMSKGRMAQTPASQPGVTAEMDYKSSSNITQPLMEMHSATVEMGLQRVCDLLRQLWKKGTTRSFYLGDEGVVTLNVPDKWSLMDYGITVKNSGKQIRDKEFTMQLMGQMLPTNPTFALEMLKTYYSNSDSEALHILQGAVDEVRQIEQMKAQAAAQQVAQQTQIEGAKVKSGLEKQQLKSAGDIQKAKIASQAHVAGKVIEKGSKLDSAELARRTALQAQMLADANAQGQQAEPQQGQQQDNQQEGNTEQENQQ